MKKTKIFCLVAVLALVACTDYKLDRGDAEKCLAGQVFKEGVGCVPAGCSQDIHCDDGNPCNGLEECIGGRCSRGGVIVESCDDGVVCTNDSCDLDLAECFHAVDDTKCEDWEVCDPQEGCIGHTCTGEQDCDDSLYCNGKEECSNGQCLAGQPPDCNDPISCTVDTCSEEADSCQHVPDHDACPSGEFCNRDQGCIELPCDTDDYCDDGSHCNGEEKCVNEKCIGGIPMICDDRVDCTVDRCDESARGCIHTPDHSLCIDDLYCNGVESCDANTGCVAGAIIGCHDNVTCTRDTCNEVVDACQYDPDDERCASTEICDPLQDCIARPECQTDQDCPGGMVCQNNKCIGMVEEPAPMDGGDDGGMPEDDGGPVEDEMGDDGGMGDDEPCCSDDGGEDACCTGDDAVPGDDGGDKGADESCLNGNMRSCDTEQPGECAVGIEYCINNQWAGCEQTIFPTTEKCDGMDNDCDGVPDDDDACACLKGCKDHSNCDQAGSETCEEVPGFFQVCILRCENDFKCPPTEDGSSRVCVDVPAFGLGLVCVCETGECPQLCQMDSDCYPFGLTICDPNNWTCTSPCGAGMECPLPYQCNYGEGICVCDSGNIGDSCLGCGLDLDCTPPTPCTYRNYETDPSTIFKECEYPCATTMDCQSLPNSLDLYCRWGEGNTIDRCACEPEMECQACIQMNPDPCEPFSMMCLTIPDPLGGANDITGCTAPCQVNEQCPQNWYCWDDGLSTHGWCIESSCHCMDVECGPGGIPEAECMMMFPGFECIQDNTGDPPVDLCTMYCMTSFDCPMGYHCDDGSGTGGMPVCRCSMSTATAGR